LGPNNHACSRQDPLHINKAQYPETVRNPTGAEFLTIQLDATCANLLPVFADAAHKQRAPVNDQVVSKPKGSHGNMCM
jgi:hypothetical protein